MATYFCICSRSGPGPAFLCGIAVKSTRARRHLQREFQPSQTLGVSAAVSLFQAKCKSANFKIITFGIRPSTRRPISELQQQWCLLHALNEAVCVGCLYQVRFVCSTIQRNDADLPAHSPDLVILSHGGDWHPIGAYVENAAAASDRYLARDGI